MIELKEKEIEKLAAITGSTPLLIKKMIAMNLLHEQRCLNALIAYDMRRLKRQRKYKVGQIIEALSERYNVSSTRVKSAIYFKKRKKYSCTVCQKEISSREYKRGNGKCNKCVAKEIEF